MASSRLLMKAGRKTGPWLLRGLVLAGCVSTACSAPVGSRSPTTPSRPDGSLPPVPASPAVPTAERSPRRAIPDDVAASLHVALGVPSDADGADDWLASREQFVMSYNPRLNVANWVAWHLDASDLGTTQRSRGFHSDTGLPRSFYVVLDRDYVGSGYDRGHLCPSADRTQSPRANLATFVLSNTHPQVHELNAGPWEKLEMREREWARAGKELFVVAGGLFDAEPKRIGKDPDPAHRVAVPSASFKIVVVAERGQRAGDLGPETPVLTVVIPNRREVEGRDYERFTTSVRVLEERSGYDFLDRVPAPVQRVLETKVFVGPDMKPAPAPRT